MSETTPEPWLRGTLTDVLPIGRAVLHALQLADEDVQKWCAPLSEDELNARPFELAAVAFHLRHIARSLHRLLTYAEGAELSDAQLSALRAESEPGATHKDIFAEWTGTQGTADDSRWLAGAHRRPHPAPCRPGRDHGEAVDAPAPKVKKWKAMPATRAGSPILDAFLRQGWDLTDLPQSTLSS
jgi:hypothetical protein